MSVTSVGFNQFSGTRPNANDSIDIACEVGNRLVAIPFGFFGNPSLISRPFAVFNLNTNTARGFYGLPGGAPTSFSTPFSVWGWGGFAWCMTSTTLNRLNVNTGAVAKVVLPFPAGDAWVSPLVAVNGNTAHGFTYQEGASGGRLYFTFNMTDPVATFTSTSTGTLLVQTKPVFANDFLWVRGTVFTPVVQAGIFRFNPVTAQVTGPFGVASSSSELCVFGQHVYQVFTGGFQRVNTTTLDVELFGFRSVSTMNRNGFTVVGPNSRIYGMGTRTRIMAMLDPATGATAAFEVPTVANGGSTSARHCMIARSNGNIVVVSPRAVAT